MDLRDGHFATALGSYIYHHLQCATYSTSSPLNLMLARAAGVLDRPLRLSSYPPALRRQGHRLFYSYIIRYDTLCSMHDLSPFVMPTLHDAPTSHAASPSHDVL